jgi:hypothetical protein
MDPTCGSGYCRQRATAFYIALDGVRRTLAAYGCLGYPWWSTADAHVPLVAALVPVIAGPLCRLAALLLSLLGCRLAAARSAWLIELLGRWIG